MTAAAALAISGGIVKRVGENLPDLAACHLAYFELLFFGLRDESRVVHRRVKGLAQRRDARRRTPGGARIGRSIFSGDSTSWRMFFVRSSLANSTSAGTSGNSGLRRSAIWIGTVTLCCGNQSGRVDLIEEIRPPQRPCDLAALHRQIDVVAALVAGDDLDLGAEQLVEHRRHGFHLRARAGSRRR